MKTRNIYLKTSIVFFLILVLNSCLEYDITTRIYPNGKLERTFQVSGDYDMIHESSSMILPTDSTWEIKTWWELVDSTKSKPDSIYFYAAGKVFKNYKELNKELKVDTNVYNQIKVKVNVKRKFRWFYTSMKYTETYRKYFPYNHLPSDEFLTSEEIKYSFSEDEDYRYNPIKNVFEPLPEADTNLILTGEDSTRAKLLEKDIEDRFEDWQTKNIFEDYFEALTKVLDKNNKPACDIAIQKKDELYDSLNIKDIADFEDSDEKIMEMVNTIVLRTSQFLNISGSEIQPSENPEMKLFADRLTFLNMNIWYKYHQKVIMPGKVIQKNSGDSQEGTYSWKLSLKDFYASDYEMTALSKIINKWAIAVSIVVVTLLLAGLIAGFLRRKP